MKQASGVTESEIVAYVGLDWADQEHVICLQERGRTKKELSRVSNRPEELQAWVAQLQQRFGTGKVAIALEQSRGAVVHALMGYGFLQLYIIPPSCLASYRKAFRISGAKDDPRDAELLLDLLGRHPDRFQAWEPDTVPTRALQLQTQYRRRLVDKRTQLTNEITSLLKNYFPQALDWAGDLTTLQACNFLQRWATLQAVQKAKPDVLRRFYARRGCRRKEVVERRLQQIRQAQPLTQDRAVIESMSLMVQSLAAILQACTEAVQELDKQIGEQFEQHPDRGIYESLPGAGQALAPRLLTALGSDRNRFETAQQIQQMSGIAPVTVTSGKSHRVHWRWACPKFMRQTFHEHARHSLKSCLWARAVYEQKRQQGKGHNAAVRVVAYKWIRIIFRCWNDQVPYDENTYLLTLQRRNPNLIAAIERLKASAVDKKAAA